ncbi:MAG: hypothetical protein HC936_00795 [Leptolyngbyaceae cyanobacterium SU_3_3]|nr:hypothetical protein [Leptolyngbyaceae cyanobacterium SU_3_3]
MQARPQSQSIPQAAPRSPSPFTASPIHIHPSTPYSPHFPFPQRGIFPGHQAPRSLMRVCKTLALVEHRRLETLEQPMLC